MTEPEPDYDLCAECGGIGSSVATCCPEPEPCMYRGVRLPCEECAPGAKYAAENGWPETIFAISERKRLAGAAS